MLKNTFIYRNKKTHICCCKQLQNYLNTTPNLCVDDKDSADYVTKHRAIIAVAGADRHSFNHAFINNINTFINENPNDNVYVVPGWEFYSSYDLMNAIINKSNEFDGIDVLLIESHSTANVLSIMQRVDNGIGLWLTSSDNWKGINFNEGAYIRLTGCNAGGNNGFASYNSIAQQIANQTQRTVWAFVNNSSQVGRDLNGNVADHWQNAISFRQEPAQMFWGQKVVPYYTRFAPSL